MTPAQIETATAEQQREVHPLDVCDCGDYRRDHENGAGRCAMPDDLCHGFKPCFRFVLWEPASQGDE